MKTAKLITMGCKVNQYDTQSMRETLRRNGYAVLDDEASRQQADLFLINTCTVTNTADQKARQVIRKAIRQHPNAKVLVTGCYAESDRETIEEIPGVTFVFGNREKADFQQYLDVLHTEMSSPTAEADPTPNPLLSIEPVQHDAVREHARFSKGVSDAGKRTRALIKCRTGAAHSVPIVSSRTYAAG